MTSLNIPAALAAAALTLALPAQAEGEGRGAAPVILAPPLSMEIAMLRMSATSRCSDECVVRDAPFTAERHFSSEQRLADGNRINTERAEKIYRDAKGRTRVESEWLSRPLVLIQDPVAGLSYRLYPHTRSGLVMRLADAAGAPNAAAASTLAAADNSAGAARVARQLAPAVLADGRSDKDSGALPVSKALGNKTMEGVTVEGQLRTTTLPAHAAGNALPLVQTYELWRSPELRMAIWWRSVDPRTGERRMRISDLARQEPPAALFTVPAGYSVREVARGH